MRIGIKVAIVSIIVIVAAISIVSYIDGQMRLRAEERLLEQKVINCVNQEGRKMCIFHCENSSRGSQNGRQFQTLTLSIDTDDCDRYVNDIVKAYF